MGEPVSLGGPQLLEHLADLRQGEHRRGEGIQGAGVEGGLAISIDHRPAAYGKTAGRTPCPKQSLYSRK